MYGTPHACTENEWGTSKMLFMMHCLHQIFTNEVETNISQLDMLQIWFLPLVERRSQKSLKNNNNKGHFCYDLLF